MIKRFVYMRNCYDRVMAEQSTDMSPHQVTLPISVFIICCDEADRIAHTIASVRDWVDEVQVIDSGSADDTCEIAQSMGAVVTHQDWLGYGPQKCFGETLCKHDWILNLDADEEVSEQMREAIIDLFAKGEPEHTAYTMHWKMVFPFQKKPSLFATKSTFVRLYNKTKSGFSDSQVHDSVLLKEGTLGELKGCFIWHRNFTSLDRWIKKMDNYTTKQAEDMYAKGRRPSNIRLVTEPVLAFLKAYFIRRNIFYGMHGLVFSWLYAYSKFMRLAKTREIYQKHGK